MALALQGSAGKAPMPHLHPALNRQLLCDAVNQGAFGVATWLHNQGIVPYKSTCEALKAHAAIKASKTKAKRLKRKKQLKLHAKKR